MYRIKTKQMEYTIPKENLIFFAKYQAINRGENFILKAIVDDEAAKQYLRGIGVEVCE